MKTEHKQILAKDSDKLCVFDDKMKHGLPSGLLKAISFAFFIAFTIFCLAAPLLHSVFEWLDDNGNTISVAMISVATIVYLVRRIRKRNYDRAKH